MISYKYLVCDFNRFDRNSCPHGCRYIKEVANFIKGDLHSRQYYCQLQYNNGKDGHFEVGQMFCPRVVCYFQIALLFFLIIFCHD